MAVNCVPFEGLGRHSDKKNERRGHIAVSATAAAIGFGIAAFAPNPYIAVAGLVLAGQNPQAVAAV